MIEVVKIERAQTNESLTGADVQEDPHDQVLEAYLGKLGERTMRETQARIHWICRQVRGETVLDVGCGQGIASVLLGREGHRVTGIDLDPEALVVANAYLANEPLDVQKAVTFVETGFLEYTSDPKKFDTLILSELLEHLFSPEAFIAQAADRLKPGGTLIVTVPFGINDTLEAKRTFYLQAPLELISERFDVVETVILGKWVGLVGRLRRKSQSATSVAPSASLMKMLEASFLKLERGRKEEVLLLRKRLQKASLKDEKSAEKIDTLRQRIAHLERERIQQTVQVASLEQRLQDAKEWMGWQRAAMDGLSRDKSPDKSPLVEQLADAKDRNRETMEQLEHLRSQLQKLEAARDVALRLFEEDKRSHAALVKRLEEELAQERKKAAHVSAGSRSYDHDEAAATERAARQQAESLLAHAEARAKARSEAWEQSEREKNGLLQKLQKAQELSAQRLGMLESEGKVREAVREAAQKELMTLREQHRRELEEERERHRKAQQQHEQSQRELLRAKAAMVRLESKVQASREQVAAAEAQVAKTRATLSFQLGFLLLHSFKSIGAFFRLPWQLWTLRREAVRRRKERKTRGAVPAKKSPPPASKVAPPPPPPRLPEVQTGPNVDGFMKMLKSLRVACICDEFTFSSYRPECDLRQLSLQNWKADLEAINPELLFIESAWRGKDDQWGSRVGHKSEEVVGVVEWCRERKIPTVFWNKEDPVHFETFLSTAKLFDYVFTTDIDCIHRYKGALGHDRVYFLPFACQPEAFNPIEKYQRKDAFCFAGAYYVRYPERTRDLRAFVSELSQFRPFEIYDRNFGKEDPNYKFPEEYRPLIKGNLPFDQIDKAYKGYRYAINLNSIKQSQSMFARRVFELLASNTITISNFSRGVRLMFGDLVFTGDNAQELLERLRSFGGDESAVRKVRLAGLRKVMEDHTYQDRFAYIVSKVRAISQLPVLLPRVVVTAFAKDKAQYDAVVESFSRQTIPGRRLLVLVRDTAGFDTAVREDIKIVTASEMQGSVLADCLQPGEWVAAMVPDDYYGPNYLRDLVLATRYSSAKAIGKVTHFVWSPTKGLVNSLPGRQYLPATTLSARSAIVRSDAVEDVPLWDWVTSLYSRQIQADALLAIDEFNYCRSGGTSAFGPEQKAVVNDLKILDEGLPLGELTKRAENIAPEETVTDVAPVMSGDALAAYFKPPANKPYSLQVTGNEWQVKSSLPSDKHDYFYTYKDLRPSDLNWTDQAKFYLDVSPGLNVQLTVVFLDAQKQKIGNVVRPANRNQEAPLPPGTAWIRLGIRILGSGAASIHKLVLGHRPIHPAQVLGRSEHLILTNNYPAYEDLYKNAFVHTRVLAYRERGVGVDVFRFRKGDALSYDEFQDVDVISGGEEALDKLLSGGTCKTVLVHFLDEAMWNVLSRYIDRIRVRVWLHGAEIHSWKRRSFNYENEQRREQARLQSDARDAFWRKLLHAIPKNLKFVFVSQALVDEVTEDLGIRIPKDSYEIIHNPINDKMFAYVPKPPEQRKRILSISPFASRKYANDLMTDAILMLSREPWFRDLEFRIIGDGPLFDEVLAPLRQFDNVHLERQFLTQSEIARLHRDYGIFLRPSRHDTQGVSRDEAMSSGLVPITSAVGAIPEFVDSECGVLAPEDDAKVLVEGITRLYKDAALFQRMSENAARRVRQQRGCDAMTAKELSLFAKEVNAPREVMAQIPLEVRKLAG